MTTDDLGNQIDNAYLAYAEAKGITDPRRLEQMRRVHNAYVKATGAKRMPRTRAAHPERTEQIALASFLDDACWPLVERMGLDPELFPGWQHTPNEARRSYRLGKSMQAQGLKRGVPDCMVYVVPVGASFCGAALELKAPGSTASRVSSEQSAWLAGLAAAGWATCWRDSEQAAVEWFKGLGYRAEEY